MTGRCLAPPIPPSILPEGNQSQFPLSDEFQFLTKADEWKFVPLNVRDATVVLSPNVSRKRVGVEIIMSSTRLNCELDCSKGTG